MRRVFALIASRRVTPVILVLFLALYIAVASFTDEALITLISLTRGSFFLSFLLALLPVNLLARLFQETGLFIRRSRALRGVPQRECARLFDEEVTLAAPSGYDEVAAFLGGGGYRTAAQGETLGAWRGIAGFPARFLFLLGAFALFLGILLSITTRFVGREMLIEGEPLPPALGVAGRVNKITLTELDRGILLARDLSIDVVVEKGEGTAGRTFGLYPPGLLHGYFLYPRYLGLAPMLRFTAPDLKPDFESFAILMIYPPGREDSAEIPGTPYRITFRLLPAPSGKDPYATGDFHFHCKLLRGDTVLWEQTVPLGGSFARDGYLLAVPEVKRMVSTDFVRDPGVPLIWLAALLLTFSLLLYIPVRVLNPRREILFVREGDRIRGYARSEGKTRRHLGVFHKALDMLNRREGGMEE